ncbi:MAG: OB-fold nucleic acid binding domain-containing protein, partial [Candidatus Saccharicenans sp.]
ISLFGDDYIHQPDIPEDVLSMSEWDEQMLLTYEKQVLGTYLSSHPLARYKKRLANLISHTIEALDPEEDFNREIRLAGIIVSVKFLKTKKEERMATFVLEDLTGQIDLTIFPEAYNRSNLYIKEGQLVWIKGKMAAEGFESRKVLVSQLLPLTEALEKLAKKTIIKIPVSSLNEENIQEMKQILKAFPGDCLLYLQLEDTSTSCLIQSAEVQSINPSEELISRIENLFGPDSVMVEY